MSSKSLILTIMVFLILFSTVSLGQQITTLKIWIEGTIGVGPEYDKLITTDVGVVNGTWVVIHNTGNVRDVLRMEGYINDSTCPPAGPVCEYEDWIKFSFKCAESVGICDDTPSSEMKYVDEIQLTPQINQTRFYVEITGYKITSVPTPVEIIINGYSLTNYTKQTDFVRIGVNITRPSGSPEPEELSGISPVWLILLLLLACFAFYKKPV